MSGSDSSPLVSVLMPAYNAKKYISLAIKSVLGQTFKDFEFIIVDDGSTDNTPSIIGDFAKKDNRIVSVRHKENLKICKALNTGIERARGKYIARMDADDWSYPDRLEKQCRFMEENPKIVIGGGSIEVCDCNLKTLNRRRYHLTDRKIRGSLFRYSPFCHPATIFRTAAVIKAGGYNEPLYDAEDYDLYFRLGLHGDFGNLPDTLLKLRTRAGSVSQAKAPRQERLTLYTRLKAVTEYGYKMNLTDKCYLTGQYLSMFIIPPKIKFWLFSKIRSLVGPGV